MRYTVIMRREFVVHVELENDASIEEIANEADEAIIQEKLDNSDECVYIEDDTGKVVYDRENN